MASEVDGMDIFTPSSILLFKGVSAYKHNVPPMTFAVDFTLLCVNRTKNQHVRQRKGNISYK
jgi:hypothetical protein